MLRESALHVHLHLCLSMCSYVHLSLKVMDAIMFAVVVCLLHALNYSTYSIWVSASSSHR